MTINEKIDKAAKWAEKVMAQPSSYPFLPGIIEILRELKESNDADKNRRYAGALGRLVTEDYDFSESELGTLLCEIADYFLPPAEDVWK